MFEEVLGRVFFGDLEFKDGICSVFVDKMCGYCFVWEVFDIMVVDGWVLWFIMSDILEMVKVCW